MNTGRRKKYRVRGRFYAFVLVFLILVGWGVFGISRLLQPPRIGWGSLETNQKLVGLVLRDEIMVQSGEFARIDCIATEGQRVKQGDEVAILYKSGYTAKDMDNLIVLQESIKDYQEKNIIKDTKDSELEELTEKIDTLKDKISQKVIAGDVRNLMQDEGELKQLMSVRKTRMAAVVEPEVDSILENMYQQADDLQAKIDTSKEIIYASGAGQISFFLDRFESKLSNDTLPLLQPNDIVQLQKQIVAKETKGQVSASGVQVDAGETICRLVNSENWYILLVLRRNENTLVKGNPCAITLEGVEAQTIETQVEDIRSEGRNDLIILRANVPIGELLQLRKVQCSIGRSVEGFLVPNKYIKQENGKAFVLIKQNKETILAEIEVLASDEKESVVRVPQDSEQKLAVGGALVKP